MNRFSPLPSLAFLLMAVPSLGTAASVTLVNGSFELPGAAKIQSGYDGATDIPGWTNNGAAGYADSGVENAGATGKDGSWVAYLMSTDGGAYQTTAHVIASGESFSLNWLAGPTSSQALNTNQLVTLFRTSDGGATRTILATSTESFGGVSGTFSPFSLNYVATAADAGSQIGIEFDYAHPTSAWAGYDGFALNVVPEPSALLLGGLGLSGLLRRRRSH